MLPNTESSTVQWIGKPNNEMLLRVQQWLQDGRTLSWRPIFSAEKFPDIPWQVLCYAVQSPASASATRSRHRKPRECGWAVIRRSATGLMIDGWS